MYINNLKEIILILGNIGNQSENKNCNMFILIYFIYFINK